MLSYLSISQLFIIYIISLIKVHLFKINHQLGWVSWFELSSLDDPSQAPTYMRYWCILDKVLKFWRPALLLLLYQFNSQQHCHNYSTSFCCLNWLIFYLFQLGLLLVNASYTTQIQSFIAGVPKVVCAFR